MSQLRDSLIGRLALYVLGGLLLIWLAMTVALYIQTEHEIGELQSQQLAEVGQLLLTHLGDEAKLPPHIAARLDDHVSMAFSLYNRSGQLISSSHRPALPPLAAGVRGEQRLELDGRSWRAVRFADADRQLTLAMPMSLRRQLALEVATDQMLPLGLMLGLCMLVVLWGLWQGLRPLMAFSHELQARHPGNLAPITTRLPSEMQPIAQRLNTLLAQIEQTLQHERRFTGDAAHELRTPLAGLQLQLELALSSSRSEARERALHNVQLSAERMTHLVDQLLKLARLDNATGLPLAPIDLPALCQSGLQQSQLQGEISVIQSARWLGDADALGLLLRNLFDNIRLHAGSEPPVDITIDGPTLQIRDHGPGVDSAWLDRLGERFARPDDSRREGVGLGLSIAQRIAQLHGSRLHFSLAADGGLCVRFALPVAADNPFEQA